MPVLRLSGVSPSRFSGFRRKGHRPGRALLRLCPLPCLRLLGTLADAALRHKRIEAHAAFGRLWESGLMSKRQAYRWLQAKMGLPEREAHIGKFSTFRCDQVIELCSQCFRAAGRPA